MHLYQKILNVLDDQKGLSDEFAKLSDYASGQALRKALREQREIGKFYGLVKIVQTLFPNEEKQHMIDYANTLDVNNKNARLMLEYCEMNELHETKRFLIEKMLVCKNATSKEWATIYNIDDQFVRGKISFLEAIKQYGVIEPKSSEMKAMMNIFKAFCYLSEQNYEIVYQLAIDMQSHIPNITDEYMHDMINGRHLLLLAECSMRKSNKEESRLFCEKLINEINDINLKCFGYLHMGNSLIFEDYEKARRVLLTGYSLSEKCAPRVRININRSITFLDNVWNRFPEYLNLESNDPSDVHELVFYYINHKQLGKATELLDREYKSIDRLTSNQTAFHYYLRGLITKRKEDFCLSIKYFKMSGDIYFREMALIELKKLDVSDCVLELLAM